MIQILSLASRLRRSPAVIAVAIAAAAVPVTCRRDSLRPKEKDMITVYQSSVEIGDPHICSDSANRLSLIFSVYESLVKMDAAGAYQPALAESWSVGEDARVWTFRLRKNVTFHNGEILRAGDVVATLGRVLDPAIGGAFGTQGVYLSYLGDAEIVEVDERTVRIVTGEPMADLLDLLVAMPISPASALERLPHEYVGSGPYRIREQSPGKIVLEAFSEYWGDAPGFRGIRWIAEPDSGKRADALLDGSADIIDDVDAEGRERILKSGSASLRDWDSGLCVIFMLNCFKGPCRDRRVRQALNYALDIDKIIAEVMPGAATPLNGYLTPHHFGYNPETPAYPYDPEKARALLEEAGYGSGLKLVFDIPAVMPDEAPRLAAVMAEQLAGIGISVEIVEHPDRAAYSEMVREKRIHDACCFDSSPRSTFRVLREKIQSTLRGPWWQGYENETVNALIKQAQATLPEGERQAIYRRVYSLVRDDAPWIFLYRPTHYWGVRPAMKGWQPPADGLLIF
ncbi:MAG: ABC transporter substrate-binding protein [Candidatus Aminicenantes bacterium]|nr:ABC transporter substrate-binding protein [Candidatus Aminicenantes bacterium]